MKKGRGRNQQIHHRCWRETVKLPRPLAREGHDWRLSGVKQLYDTAFSKASTPC